MKKIYIIATVLFIILFSSCKIKQREEELPTSVSYGYDKRLNKIRKLQNEINLYVSDKDARIGIAVLTTEGDTILVNGKKEFPMMSVFKFPIALALAHVVDKSGGSFDEEIIVSKEELKENTYSPMLKKYGRKERRMTLHELLEWSLKESDNNAADILLKYIGGISGLNDIMKEIQMEEGIKIGATEDDMHRDPGLIYLNRSTPLAMAELFFDYYKENRNGKPVYKAIGEMLEDCQTGSDRLSAPLSDKRIILGHKTGTGDILQSGRISAINDCGYVILPNGISYAIAVFVADSGYDMKETSKIIADISEMVYKSLI